MASHSIPELERFVFWLPIADIDEYILVAPIREWLLLLDGKLD
jgi:hypothetical protein